MEGVASARADAIRRHEIAIFAGADPADRPPDVPSRYGERYAVGHVVESGRHLFVNPGTGTSILPVRFLVPPEVSLLELR